MAVIRRWSARAAAPAVLAALLAAFGPQPAPAQDAYPSRFVRIITSTGTGSGVDVHTRILADYLTRDWGQQVVIENVPTGGGLIAAQQVSGAVADGYTLLVASASSFTILPIRQERALPIVSNELKPVAYFGDQPFVIGVSPALGVGSIRELIDLAKRDPDKVLFAGSSSGTLPHMTGELLKVRSGAPYRYVPYRSSADGLKDLLAGQINMVVDGLAALDGTMKSGHVKALAITSAKRIRTLPELPTVAETIPGFLSIGWAALMAPTGVPDAIVSKINGDLIRLMDRPEIRPRLEELGAYPVPMTPDEVGRFIKSEQEQWWPIIRQILAQPAPEAK